MAFTKRIPLEQRLLAHVVVGGADDCWPWQGSISTQGYGRVASGGSAKTAGSPLYAHRVMYELRIGAVPGGLELDHLCYNADPACPGGRWCLHRRCCNPAHMEPVTHRVNSLRGLSPPAIAARRDECIGGHPLDGLRATGRRYCKTCDHAYKARLRVAA